MITPVDNVSFNGWKQDIKLLVPRKLVGYSQHTPKSRPYEEFHFMPEFKKKNPIKELSVSMKKKQKNLEAKWDSLFYRLNYLFY